MRSAGEEGDRKASVLGCLRGGGGGGVGLGVRRVKSLPEGDQLEWGFK